MAISNFIGVLGWVNIDIIYFIRNILDNRKLLAKFCDILLGELVIKVDSSFMTNLIIVIKKF